jgi:ADP-ribose pyrophosphatase YjhB (NUDIX family)
MSEPGNRAAAPRVGVYALIGQDERLLLVEHPDHDTLPGGAVHTGEPVEQALRRTLRDQLDATIADLDFCAVIEHGISEHGQQPASEVAFLFDVTLTNPDRLNQSTPQPHRWADQHELSSLRPQAIRNELTQGTLSADNPWRAWTP